MLTTCTVDLSHRKLITSAGHEICLKGQDSNVSPVSEPANTHIVPVENLSVPVSRKFR